MSGFMVKTKKESQEWEVVGKDKFDLEIKETRFPNLYMITQLNSKLKMSSTFS